VAGADVVRDTESVRYRIGVALQEASLDPGQTGRELLDLQANLFAIPKSVARTRVAELIELVDLGDAIDRRVETYSGGMRRRLDLALALVHDPEVLFLDEPTTGLDPVSRRQIWDEVRRLNREQGLTVFLTTQYLEEADELADRVVLTEAADRKVRGYSGGMKRRLDLALALVHRPRILFLDEPTTGLDPQSRTALWEEVARLARDDGVTVFLTTQYLEEADVLADRVGIIDHGRIVAEGTPSALKAEIGRPSVHVIPCRAEDGERIAVFLSRFGDSLPGDDLAVRLGEGLGLADVVRGMDADGIAVDDIELRAPTLDDVFLAKTGRTLEGAAEEESAT
jgi:ABC-type multidrug transport system ATPase subunit